jgi:hypothetical protein
MYYGDVRFAAGFPLLDNISPTRVRQRGVGYGLVLQNTKCLHRRTPRIALIGISLAIGITLEAENAARAELSTYFKL